MLLDILSNAIPGLNEAGAAKDVGKLGLIYLDRPNQIDERSVDVGRREMMH
jgi:hypothetical protein